MRYLGINKQREVFKIHQKYRIALCNKDKIRCQSNNKGCLESELEKISFAMQTS